MKHLKIKTTFPVPSTGPKKVRVVIVENPMGKWSAHYWRARDNANTHAASVRYANSLV